MDLTEIEKSLEKNIEDSEREIKEAQEKAAAEVARLKQEEEEERLRKVDLAIKAEEARLERRRKEKEEAEAQRKEEEKRRAEAETAHNQAEAKKAVEKSRQEALKKKFLELQILREKKQKAAEIVHTASQLEPEAPVNVKNPGDAVEGTGGETPDTPLMSEHLRKILRQSARNY